MIRVAICDDEEIFIKKLRECLNKYIEETGKEISIVEFKDGNELLKNYNFSNSFTSSDFSKITHLNTRKSRITLNVLTYLEIVKRVGKTGNSYIYEITK